LVAKSSSPFSPRRTAALAGSLGPAHKGYLYQDQATPHFFALSLLDRFEETIVDRKAVDDGRFDDLSVRHNSREIRRQFKSSDDPARTFEMHIIFAVFDEKPSHTVAPSASLTSEVLKGALTTFAKVDLLDRVTNMRAMGYEVAVCRIKPYAEMKPRRKHSRKGL
jgi:hypothetical protein